MKCAVAVAVLLSTTGIAAAQNPAAKSMPKGVPTIAAPEPRDLPASTGASDTPPQPQPVKHSKTAKAAARPLPVVIPQHAGLVLDRSIVPNRDAPGFRT